MELKADASQNKPRESTRGPALGSHGSCLTPAQQAQIALARASYCKSKLVLLDDPLSLLDRQTGSHVFEKLIRDQLRERTCIVVMPPEPDYLKHFDQVVLLKEGRKFLQGPPEEVMATQHFRDLLAEGAPPSELAMPDVGASGEASSQMPVGVESIEETHRSPSQMLLGVESVEETHCSPSWDAVRRALLAGGTVRLCILMGVVMTIRLVTTGQILVLGLWADEMQGQADRHKDMEPMKTMIALTLVLCVLQALQAYMLQDLNVAASRNIFQGALSGIQKAPWNGFWDRQPAGRILNRLSGDVLTVDMALSSSFLIMARFVVSVIVQQIYCFFVMPPWLATPTYGALAIISVAFWRTSAPLQSLGSVALSECHEDYLRLDSSRRSARAYGYHGKLLSLFLEKTGLVIKPAFLGVACTKHWVMIRLAFCFCFQCTACLLFGIVEPEVGPGGLAVIVSSTFNIIQDLDGFVDAASSLLGVSIALGRLEEYMALAPSTPQVLDKLEDSRQHQSDYAGASVALEDFSAGYVDGRDALCNVTLAIAAQERVAVTGESGAGKSTLLLCLMRSALPRSGRLLLNGVDAGSMSREELRGMVGYAPQLPSTFSGSLRFNVDPAGHLSDTEIIYALACVQLLSLVTELGKGLDHDLNEGIALSFGQRQLLCLARAICCQPKLLLLDECISSLELGMQKSILESILKCFPLMTVVVATKSPEMAALMDRVVLLEKGEVAPAM